MEPHFFFDNDIFDTSIKDTHGKKINVGMSLFRLIVLLRGRRRPNFIPRHLTSSKPSEFMSAVFKFLG